ncbi:hypothetical protein LguiB_018752 [Lonicera macranthoides]
MADMKSHEAASHDVFLSFRGEDTRKTFVDHLYTALVGACFRTFRDNEGIDRGEKINSELERAILQSRHEAQFIQEVVEVIEEKLKRTIRNVPPNLVGIESRAKDINLWLQDCSTEAGIGSGTITGLALDMKMVKEDKSLLSNQHYSLKQRRFGFLSWQSVLETLIISGCSNLDEFPKEMGNMESLKVFHADKIAMSPSTSTTSKDGLWPALISTWVTRPRKCPKLSWGSLPHSIVSLSLSDCNLHDYSFPMDFSNLPSLKKVDLSRNPICSLPDCIRGLTSLEMLQMSFCTSLQELIDLPSIRDLRLTNCSSLENITFQSKVCKAPAFMLVGCKKLVQIEGRFKLENVENLDNEVMYQHDLQALNSFKVEMFNVPHDRGIINIFQPGGEVPGCFSSKSVGSSVSITVPPSSSSFHGLNVRVVYAFDKHWGPWSLFFVLISNETKDLKFKYFPTCYGLTKPDEYITWSSYWKFHKSQMDIGDQLKIKLSTGSGFKVKEIGVRLVYYKQAHSSDDFIPTEVSHWKFWMGMDSTQSHSRSS